jgi:RNA polymerase sigma-70 factor (ECF subfamily)
MATGYSPASVITLGVREESVPATRESQLNPWQDDELIEGCQAGNMAAFEQLYRKHGARMKSIALNLVGNLPDAEDAVQDTFLKIYRSAGSYKRDAAFSTWIYRILVNACYDLMRRRRRRKPESSADDMEQAVVEGRVAVAADHPLRMTLEQCLSRLQPRSRTVFLLYEVEGFKHREIAGILKIPEGTSKNLLFEAKKELQRLIWAARKPSRSNNAD